MFKIEKEPKFWATVTVFTPVDEGHREDTFRARFKVQPAETVEGFDLALSGDDIAEFLRTTIVDLDDIQDDDGKTVAFSDELLNTMIGNYNARIAMRDTYIAAVTKARAGN